MNNDGWFILVYIYVFDTFFYQECGYAFFASFAHNDIDIAHASSWNKDFWAIQYVILPFFAGSRLHAGGVTSTIRLSQAVTRK